MVLDTIVPDEYGALRLTDGDRSNRATRGLLVLEIQDCLMAFLVKVCQGILHDKQLDLESLHAVPVQPEPPTLPTTKEGEWLSVLDLARELPYLAPQELNLDRVQSLIQARLREWEDYARAMREDPSFFADVVGDWSEHSSEQVPLPGRKTHPDLTSPIRKRQFWDRTISSDINEIYENLVVWEIVSNMLTKVVSYQKAQSKMDQARPRDVPGYTDAVQLLKVLLEKRVIEKMQRELGFLLPSSPPMRSLFERR